MGTGLGVRISASGPGGAACTDGMRPARSGTAAGPTLRDRAGVRWWSQRAETMKSNCFQSIPIISKHFLEKFEVRELAGSEAGAPGSKGLQTSFRRVTGPRAGARSQSLGGRAFGAKNSRTRTRTRTRRIGAFPTISNHFQPFPIISNHFQTLFGKV